MTSDSAWLAGHALLLLIDAPVTPRAAVSTARAAGMAGVVAYPTQLGSLGDTGEVTVASVVGYPSGRHHSLVKAAEARLAVAQGATEVWLTPDPSVSDPNVLLAEFVTVREAVPVPVTLAVLLGEHADAVAQAAALAGVDRLVGERGASISTALPQTRWVDTLEEVLDALDGGVDRVAVSDVAAVSPTAG